MVVVPHCFLQAPPLSRLFLPVFSCRPTTLFASYGQFKTTFMFSSAAKDITPLKSPVRAAVKRVSRKHNVALASDLQFDTPLKIVEYPDPILRAKNRRIGVFDENLKNLVDAMFDVMYK